MFTVDSYLQRIGISGRVGAPTLAALTKLQLAHLVHVPFENLHAFHRRGVRTDVDWSFATRALDARGSRVTLRMDVLRQRDGTSAFRETPVARAEWSDALLRHFSLVDSNVR